MARQLDKAQVNHLRRLLGWVRCSDGVFQSPEDMEATWRRIAPTVGIPSEDGKRRLAESYAKAMSIPLYIRAALKALEPVVREADGEVVDPVVERKLRYSRKQLAQRTKRLSAKHRILTLKGS